MKSAANPVADFMSALDHPSKAEIEAVRALILGTDPTITEGIKWNAPSFARGAYFATFHLKAKAGVQVILHLGAKVTAAAADGFTIDDPQSLLTWLAKDRATVIFKDMAAVTADGAAFQAIIRQWLTQVA